MNSFDTNVNRMIDQGTERLEALKRMRIQSQGAEALGALWRSVFTVHKPTVSTVCRGSHLNSIPDPWVHAKSINRDPSMVLEIMDHGAHLIPRFLKEVPSFGEGTSRSTGML